MEDKNFWNNAVDSPSNLMSFDSPVEKTNFLLPNRTESIKNSPLLTVQNSSVSNISPDPINLTPVAASTPFTQNHVPGEKFTFPSPMVDVNTTVSDPFEFVEQKAMSQANDPFEMVSEEALKVIPAADNSNSSANKTDSLNKGFYESSSLDESKETSCVASKEDAKPSLDDEDDLDKVTAPWEGADSIVSDSDNDDDDGDLQDVIRRASIDLMSSFTMSPAEILDQENVSELRLTQPQAPKSLLDESDPLDLEVPPMSLDTSVMSSPIFDHLASEQEVHSKSMIVEEVFSQLELKAQKLPTPRMTKPLSVITNSPAIINPPAKVTNLPKSKLPSRLASRLLQPRVFKKHE